MFNITHSQSKAYVNERNSHMEKINNVAFLLEKSSLLEKLLHPPLVFNVSSECVPVCVRRNAKIKFASFLHCKMSSL